MTAIVLTSWPLRMLQEGYLLSKDAIGRLKEVTRRVLGATEKHNQPSRKRPGGSDLIPFRAVVVGIAWDAMTHQKTLTVQRMTALPYTYDGAMLIVDGGIDSMIVCGDIVLCFPVQRIDGDTEVNAALFAIPMISVEQGYLDEPDADCITRMVQPCMPRTPSEPCIAAPPP